MSETLTGIQRDVVIQYLRSELPTLKILSTGTYESEIELEKGSYAVQQTVVIFSKRIVPQWMRMGAHEIRVSFYFRKRGLQFSSVLQINGENAALGIPDTIEKTADTISFETPSYRGKLYYHIDRNEQSYVPCVSSDLFPLFNPFIWKTVEPDDEVAFFSLLSRYSKLHQATDLPISVENFLIKTEKILFFPEKRLPAQSPFAYDACFTVRDLDGRAAHSDELAAVREKLDLLADLAYIPVLGITGGRTVSIDRAYFEGATPEECALRTEEQLAFLPAAAYLSHIESSKPESVEGRIDPIEILYLTDSYVCFGCSLNTISLTEREDYLFNVAIGFRKLSAMCTVLAVMVEGERVAVVCRFSGMKPEDRRFLYERHYGAMLRSELK